MSVLLVTDRALPCHTEDPELWFAEESVDLAKSFCRRCPIRRECLTEAFARSEPWGVWGGELFDQGRIVPAPKAKGRPRKDAAAVAARAERELAARLAELVA